METNTNYRPMTAAELLAEQYAAADERSTCDYCGGNIRIFSSGEHAYGECRDCGDITE